MKDIKYFLGSLELRFLHVILEHIPRNHETTKVTSDVPQAIFSMLNLARVRDCIDLRSTISV